MRLHEKELRRLIRISLLKEEKLEIADEVEEDETSTAAGKKTEKLMDGSAMNALKAALDKATTKDSVKETLQQIFQGLGENGQKYLKLALKELAQEM
jgi:hypothetical protein